MGDASSGTDAENARSKESDAPELPGGAEGSRTLLLSRTLITWAELVVVGLLGSILSGATSGPPRFIIYLATTLVSVGVLIYNVDRLVQTRL